MSKFSASRSKERAGSEMCEAASAGGESCQELKDLECSKVSLDSQMFRCGCQVLSCFQGLIAIR